MKPIVVVIDVLIKNDSILLAKRLNKEEYGEWGFPGGKVNENELLADTVGRELFEETGLIMTADPIFLGYIEARIHQYFLEMFFLVPSFSGKVTNNEPHKHDEWEWVPFDKLNMLKMTYGLRRYLETGLHTKAVDILI